MMIFKILININDNNILKIKFLIENIACASYIDFCKTLIKLHCIQNGNFSLNESIKFQRKIVFTKKNLQIFLNNLKELDSVQNVYFLDLERFPGKIIKIEFIRYNQNILQYKSQASIKRKIVENRKMNIQSKNPNDLFRIQNCSVTLFAGGKTLITGAQSKPDLYNVFNVFKILFNSF